MDASEWSDLHRTGERSGKHGSSHGIVGRHVDTSGALDLHRKHDREAAARSSSNGGNDMKEIVALSLHNHGHNRLNMMGHDLRAIVAIKSTSPPDQTARIFRVKIPFKNRCTPLFSS